MRLRMAKRLLVLVPILAGMSMACGGGGSGGSAGNGGNGANGGSGGNGAIGGFGGSGGPVFGGQHPRILINPDNLARIKANYGTVPVAAGFKDMVDRAMGGEDVYG